MKTTFIELKNEYKFSLYTGITGTQLIFNFQWNKRAKVHYFTVIDGDGTVFLKSTKMTFNNPIILNVNSRLKDKFAYIIFVKRTDSTDDSLLKLGDNYYMAIGYDG